MNKLEILDLGESCEKAKIQLSLSKETIVLLRTSNRMQSVRISRALFEYLNRNLFNEITTAIKKLMSDARLSANNNRIDEILLIGGSTQMPKIKQILVDLFGDTPINVPTNCDGTVALGAAMYAKNVLDHQNGESHNRFLLDVVPFSFGIETSDGKMCALIKRNEVLAAVRSASFTRNQLRSKIRVYHGEDGVAENNTFLGEFQFENDRFFQSLSVRVRFEMKTDGILRIDVRPSSSSEEQTFIVNERKYNDNAFEHMREMAEVNRLNDMKRKTILDARMELEEYCFRVRDTVAELKGDISMRKRRHIEEECENIIKWLCNSQDSNGQEIFQLRRKIIKIMFEEAITTPINWKM